jgi:hypothetical protein
MSMVRPMAINQKMMLSALSFSEQFVSVKVKH